MMRSVSMSSPGTTTPRPRTWAMASSAMSGHRRCRTEDGARVRDHARYRGRDDHHRAHQDRASGDRTLTALEVAVARARAQLIADELVGVHREAHRAAGGAPLEPGVLEHLIDAFAFARLLDQGRPGHRDGVDAR